MVENKNKNNFYSKEEMDIREKRIPTLKADILNKLKDLASKVESEEPFPHGNQRIEDLGDINDELDNLLSKWYY